MNYIVLDLEWNQCPDGRDHENASLPFEIVSIGAVKVDSSLRPVDSYYQLIRPQLYTTLHPIIKDMTGLEESELAKGRHFPEAARNFFAWCGEDPLYCTWGSQDLTEFQRNLSWYHLPSPFPFPLLYYDLQKIFSIVYEDRKTRRSLEFAIDYLHLDKKEPFHNAYSDAVYTAQIMASLTEEDILSNSSVDYYRIPQNRRQEIHLTYGTYAKYVSKPFPDKEEALRDRTVVSTYCYLCRRPAKKKIRWFSTGGRNYFSLARCEKHGWLKGKIRMRQHTDGSFYVIKTLKLIGDEEAYSIKEKQEILRLKRRLRRTFSRSRENDLS